MRYVQDTYHPRLGWFSIPGLRNLAVYDGKFLNTNSLGLRGTYEPQLKKTPGRTRILFFGDSFTFGDEVSDDETYCHYLQQALPQAEILNFGVHGYGHDQMLLLWREIGLKMDPDIVILGFVYRDSFRNLLSFRDFAKPKFEVDDKGLVLTNVPVPTPEVVLAAEPYRLALGDLADMLRLALSQTSGEHEQRARALTTEIVGEFVDSVRDSGAEPMVFYLPMPSELHRYAKGEPVVVDFVEELSREIAPPITTFSTLPGFERALEEGRELKKHGHWSPLGNRIIADQIEDFLVQNNLVPPSND